MNLLAIETSTDLASVALQVGADLLCEQQASAKTHAQVILPIIERLLAHSELRLSQLDAIVFGCGPGSFTGLRIACSVAKGLAFAHDLGVIPVSSLAAIAYSAREKQGQKPVLAVVDARMQELYWAYFASDTFTAKEELNAAYSIDISASEPVLLAGVGIETYWDQFSPALKAKLLPPINCYPDAAAMIKLATITSMKPIAAIDAQPIYVRNQVTQGDARG